jgi:hypothetical protein
MKRESFLNTGNYFWFWFSLCLTVFSFFAYILNDPIGGRNGGTAVGYALGVVSTVCILYLMWYGIRKRAYYSRYTTLKTILSSHIWIGLSLIFIVPLHSGFSFGYNVHTATYVLMLVTVITGIWGVFLFRIYPRELVSQRGGPNAVQLATALYGIKGELTSLIDISSSGQPPLSETQQSAFLRSDNFMRMVQIADCEKSFLGGRGTSSGNSGPGYFQLLFSRLPAKITDEDAARLLENIPEKEIKDAISCMQLLHKKRELYNTLIQEARAQGILRGWLFLHVPLSVALCVCLALHIFSVFFYW